MFEHFSPTLLSINTTMSYFYQFIIQGLYEPYNTSTRLLGKNFALKKCIDSVWARPAPAWASTSASRLAPCCWTPRLWPRPWPRPASAGCRSAAWPAFGSRPRLGFAFWFWSFASGFPVWILLKSWTPAPLWIISQLPQNFLFNCKLVWLIWGRSTFSCCWMFGFSNSEF